jgi:arginase
MSLLENYIGYASGLAARDPGCQDGPVSLFKNHIFKNTQLLYAINNIDNNINKNSDKYAVVSELCTRLSVKTAYFIQQKKLFAVIGGDHSCAIGAWSGVAHALRDQDKTADLGLIWIDAHLDSHTPDSTPSGNIHGMPVAALLGYGNKSLTDILDHHPKIKPENLCMIGMRSYESEEQKLIQKLNIRVFYIEEILKLGFEAVFMQAKKIVTAHTAGYGLSLDIDAIDPVDAPGTGTPEKNGISAGDIYNAFRKAYLQHQDDKFLGVEIAEFDPHRDINHQTEKLIVKLLEIFK